MPPRKKAPDTPVQTTPEAPVLALEPVAEKTNTEAQDIPKIVPEASEEVVTLVLSHANLTTVVREVFYLGQLGGKPTPKFLPRLQSPPFIVKVDVTPAAAEHYGKNVGRNEHDESVSYNQLIIKSADPFKLIQEVLDIGLKGGILTPKKVVQTGIGWVIPALIQGVVENSPTVSVLPSK